MKKVTRQDNQRTGCGNIRMIEHDTGEVAFNLAKNGSCPHAWASAMRDACNIIVDNGGDLGKLAKKLEGINCHKQDCCISIIGAFLKGES